MNNNAFKDILDEVGKIIVGKRLELKIVLASILAGGHILLEGVPGVAKTLMAKTIARASGLRFSRIQFTPDLLPTDVLGTYVYNQSDGEFRFRKGPIFANIVLADEINRASPRTQSAFLEAMQEGQVTLWGKTYEIEKPFTVLATMNPIEMEGVYPLPEAQVDRFMAKVVISYPSRDEMMEIIDNLREIEEFQVDPIGEPDIFLEGRERLWDIHVEDNIKKYVVELVEATRRYPYTRLGASPRGAIYTLLLSRALAIIDGLDYVSPELIKEASKVTLPHRIILKPEARLRGIDEYQVLDEILNMVKPP